MSADRYLSEQVQRTLKVMLVLANRDFSGMRLKDVAAAVDVPAPTALRALENLRAAGLAERDPAQSDVWMLGPKLVQIAHAFDQSMVRAQAALDERRQRYTRLP
ncbi:IclR family transcriptional regulator [Bordetella ansorpii]|uniref:IclR family transcriptional regulator n=1 Tax=Bordetella ansorpii TaxID=288768 RepID=A0A157SVW4_9BORD|nr:helix-turn-helix domain-containing protein [Bordetella ansorpii]SAI74587.1 IclR family transcriptional regulator [Bordetella ansorpii]